MTNGTESRVFGPTWEQARGQSWSVADDEVSGYVAEYRTMGPVRRAAAEGVIWMAATDVAETGQPTDEHIVTEVEAEAEAHG